MAVLKDHVIIVTGASEGIGRALCKALAPQGPLLVLAARNKDRLEELRAEVESAGAKTISVPTDVTDPAACKALIDEAVNAFGRIDVLVNNAGGTMWTNFEDIRDLDIFDHLLKLNYLSAVHCTYHALPFLKQTRGRIVGVASVAGLVGVPTRTGYAAAKHAMFGFFDSLRIELRGSGVSVTMIAPDFVLSEIHRRALDGEGKPLGTSPLNEGKIMTAEECAELMVTAIENRERLLITSFRGRFGRWIQVLAPRIIDSMAARAIRRKQ